MLGVRGSRGGSWSGRIQDWRTRALALRERHPTLTQTVRTVAASQTLDRCFVLAAQILITAVPMLIAASAFAPAALRARMVEGVTRTLGLTGQSALHTTALFAGGNTARETVGVVGLLFALASATSLSRRLQRMYEFYWTLAPGRMTSSAGRWVVWIVVWVAAFAVQGPLRAGAGVWAVLGWIGSGAMAVALWWWTPHLLLLGRIGWRRLLPTALATGLATTVVGVGSVLFMPYATRHSVAEYGPFGIVLTLMSWLLVSAGVIVVGGALGRIAARRPGETLAAAPAAAGPGPGAGV